MITVGSIAPLWVRPVAEQFESLLRLPFNWDGYGAESPKLPIVGKVILLLGDLLQDSSPPPSVIPTLEGGIQVEWHRRGIDLEIEIQPNGQNVAFYQDRRNGDEWEGDPAENRDDLKRIIRLLSRPE